MVISYSLSPYDKPTLETCPHGRLREDFKYLNLLLHQNIEEAISIAFNPERSPLKQIRELDLNNAWHQVWANIRNMQMPCITQKLPEFELPRRTWQSWIEYGPIVVDVATSSANRERCRHPSDVAAKSKLWNTL